MPYIDDKTYAELRENFIKIKKRTEQAIDKAKAERHNHSFSNEAINWVDLHCVDVDFIVGEFDCWYLATIEEAAPDRPSLLAFIRDNVKISELNDEIGHEVYFVTEW